MEEFTDFLWDIKGIQSILALKYLEIFWLWNFNCTAHTASIISLNDFAQISYDFLCDRECYIKEVHRFAEIKDSSDIKVTLIVYHFGHS